MPRTRPLRSLSANPGPGLTTPEPHVRRRLDRLAANRLESVQRVPTESSHVTGRPEPSNPLVEGTVADQHRVRVSGLRDAPSQCPDPRRVPTAAQPVNPGALAMRMHRPARAWRALSAEATTWIHVRRRPVRGTARLRRRRRERWARSSVEPIVCGGPPAVPVIRRCHSEETARLGRERRRLVTVTRTVACCPGATTRGVCKRTARPGRAASGRG